MKRPMLPAQVQSSTWSASSAIMRQLCPRTPLKTNCLRALATGQRTTSPVISISTSSALQQPAHVSTCCNMRTVHVKLEAEGHTDLPTIWRERLSTHANSKPFGRTAEAVTVPLWVLANAYT